MKSRIQAWRMYTKNPQEFCGSSGFLGGVSIVYLAGEINDDGDFNVLPLNYPAIKWRGLESNQRLFLVIEVTVVCTILSSSPGRTRTDTPCGTTF